MLSQVVRRPVNRQRIPRAVNGSGLGRVAEWQTLGT